MPDDAIPETLQPLFDAVFKEFYPMLAGTRDELQRALPKLLPERPRLPRILGEIEFPMGDGRYHRAAVPYTLWMAQRVLDDCRSLGPEARASVDAWLQVQGAPEAMKFDIGVRLQRAGLHVRVER